jgi:hypothetical protein
MEKKKKLLIKVLKKLKPYRNLAEGFLALIDSQYCTNKTIDGLIALLQDSIKIVKDAKEKMTFKKSLDTIKKIRKAEEEDLDKMTDNDLDKLLASN